MDMTNSITPKSDQLNADDFLTGPRTFTITADVGYQSAEQPFGLVLDGNTAHPYKPGKSMRRVLVAAWGKESSVYVGRQLTLYTDPTIKFAGQDVGGIRIAAMSHIDKPLKLALTVAKGKKGVFTVAPLLDKTVDIKTGEIINSADRSSESVDKIADNVTSEQTNRIGALLTTLGMTDSAIQLAYVGDVVEHAITSPSQLSHGEADRVIAYLRKDVEQIEQSKVSTEANGDE